MDIITEKVITIVSESLVIDKEDIKPHSLLFTELGIDSLDFLDMIFTFEKEFKVKLRDEDLEKLTRLDIPTDGEENEGYLSLDDVELISKWIPQIKSLPQQDKITREKLFSLLTVESIVLLIKKKLPNK